MNFKFLNCKINGLFSTGLILVLLMQSVHSVDITSAMEGLPCFELETTSPDLNWLHSVQEWYFVTLSRLDLYTFSTDLLEKQPSEVYENQVYYDSCINWKTDMGNMSFSEHGFGQQQNHNLQPMDDHFGKVKFNSDGGMSGTAYMTLTDNKTFTFTAICSHDLNQMMWAVGSPYKTLPKETIQLVHDHAESLGFKKEYFTGLRYDNCDGVDSVTTGPLKDEL